MTLATHTIIGLGLASVFPHQPAAAFAVSLVGHYLTDTIPHWDYTPPLIVKNKSDHMNTRLVGGWKFWAGLLMVGGEFLLGIAVGLLVFGSDLEMNWAVILASIVGSVLPDFFQLLYLAFRRQPWIAIQKFHNFCHSSAEIENPFWGILSQVILCIVFIFAINFL